MSSHTPLHDLGKVAVVVAHPGHELMVYHWFERHRPLYCCLTDGSGGAATSRVASTSRLLDRVGATRGPIFGCYADKDVYRLLLEGRVDVFAGLTRAVADALLRADIDTVAGDAVEGFNPVHDVCRFVIDGAVARVQRLTGRALRNYDFVLDSPPTDCPAPLRASAQWVRLDEAAVERKLAAAHDYSEMREEVQLATDRFGKQAFAVECLRTATTQDMVKQFEEEVPLYEHYGQVRNNQNVYHAIIRFRQHVVPVIAAITEASQA